MLTWISEQAKWIIYISGVFIVIGLVMMGNGQTGTANVIATVDGVDINLSEYQQALEYSENQYAGQNLKDADRVKLRREVLNQIIQRRELTKELDANSIHASSVEMFNDLKNNPPAEWKRVELFATNGAFDQAKYEAWLSNDSIYDDPSIRQYEQVLKYEKVPMKQLQNFVSAGFRPTNLEAKFNVIRRDTRFKLNMVTASIDSFDVPMSFASEEKVKAYFEANPDSFVSVTDLADYDVITLKQEPSAFDEQNSLKFAKFLAEQAKEGADFAQLAAENSEDVGSAKNGGELGGFNAASVFVKEFSEVGFALDSGAISEPVKTQFGYHVIKSAGKVEEDGIVKANLSHILIKVSVGTETIDSLRAILDDVRTEALNSDLKSAAEKKGLKVESISKVSKGGALGKYGFFMGLESYSWKEQAESISEVLQSESHFTVVQKTATHTKGTRDLAKNKSAIELLVVKAEKQRLAKEFLATKLAEIKAAEDLSAWVASTPKATFDTTAWTSLESYVPGIGFANPNANVLFDLKKGDWSDVIDSDRNVVVTKILEKSAPDESQIKLLVSAETRKAKEYLGATLFNNWVKILPRRIKVEDDLYEFYSL
jgi:peptidyl-prolyl cis-trans isomerase D